MEWDREAARICDAHHRTVCFGLTHNFASLYGAEAGGLGAPARRFECRVSQTSYERGATTARTPSSVSRPAMGGSTVVCFVPREN